MKLKRILCILLTLSMLLLMAGCVDQNPSDDEETGSEVSEETSEATDATEEADSDGTDEELSSDSGENGEEEEEEYRIVATSGSAVAICELLDLDLVGAPTSTVSSSERYSDATPIGGAMSPDMEIIASLHPTDVIGPDSLESSLKASYEAAGIPYTFLNLRSVEAMYECIVELGEKYNRQEQAAAAVAEYEATLAELEELRDGQEGPKVLVLMGFPGTYCEATDNSYIGSMVALAGGENVVVADDEFVYWNSEALAMLDPDYILWTCHALKEQTEEMFQEEFSTNDIWSHFRAVQEGKIFAMDSSIFNMSATFDWPEGLEWLYNLFYQGGDETETPTQIGTGD